MYTLRLSLAYPKTSFQAPCHVSMGVWAPDYAPDVLEHGKPHL